MNTNSVSLGRHFRWDKYVSKPCFLVCMCVYVCHSGSTWQGVLCRQLKLLINALLDNTQANPIIWQAVIRAFASLTAWLSGSLQGADMLSVDCFKGEQKGGQLEKKKEPRWRKGVAVDFKQLSIILCYSCRHLKNPSKLNNNMSRHVKWHRDIFSDVVWWNYLVKCGLVCISILNDDGLSWCKYCIFG